jgi:hypothetical protein
MLLRALIACVGSGLLALSLSGCGGSNSEGEEQSACISPTAYQQPALYSIMEAGGQASSLQISSNTDGSYQTILIKNGSQTKGSINFNQGRECEKSVNPLTVEERILVYGNIDFDTIAQSYFSAPVIRQSFNPLRYSNGEQLDVEVSEDSKGSILSLTIMHGQMLVYSIKLT